ncbi:MAG TPA: hypothetical protein PKC24_11580 [Cyclobacteriaceae bacterium]|nr:hypothetical protein [Cyclobacteriaceae bacterium]
MNYKTTTLLLTIIVVALITYIIYNLEKADEQIVIEDGEATIKVEAQLIGDYESLKLHLEQRLDSVNKKQARAGRPINPAQANRMIRDYHRFMQAQVQGYDSTKSIYGYTFSLDEINDFMRRIEVYNRTSRNPDETISGVRVYLGRKNITGGISYNDVFLIPVKGTRFRNFYQVDRQYDKNTKSFDVDDPSILNSSLPCPTQCN